jgi:hypothetical protein
LANDVKECSLSEKILKIIVERFNQSLVDIYSNIKKRNGKDEYNESVELIKIYENLISEYFEDYFKSKSMASFGNKTYNNRQVEDPLLQHLKFKEVQQSDILLAEQNNNIVSLDPVGKINSESKRNLVAYYKKHPRTCWEVPLQYNESAVLYYFWYTFAKIVDIVIPGRREQPFLNLRFLANPFIFALVMFAMVVIFFIYE